MKQTQITRHRQSQTVLITATVFLRRNPTNKIQFHGRALKGFCVNTSTDYLLDVATFNNAGSYVLVLFTARFTSFCFVLVGI